MYVKILEASSPTTLERLVNIALVGIDDSDILGEQLAVVNAGGYNVNYVALIVLKGDDPNATGKINAVE